MKTSITLFLATLLTVLHFSASAQGTSGTSLGLRLGYDNGVTVKHMISGRNALEGILSTRYRGFQFTGLFEHHIPFSSDSRWSTFFGVGGHVGAYHGKYYDPYYFGPDHHHHHSAFVNVGVDGIAGLQYDFAKAPLNMSLDVKPAIDLVYVTPIYFGGAFSIRYVF